MGRLFGTDGVRGLANGLLSPELVLRLGRAAAQVLTEHSGSRPLVAVGRDPRASGFMLESALVAGLLSAGADVVVLGVVPTPAVAFLTRFTGAVAGVAISASHNPMPDNGIKLFGPEGFKLPDAVERRIEALAVGLDQGARPVGAAVGRVRQGAALVEAYLDHLVEGMDGLDGMEVVVDCANGAASGIAPEAYRRAGAKVTALADAPDGENINEQVGSTHPQALQDAVRASGSTAVGIAHDGDADRVLAVDECGGLVDGDVILALAALDCQRRDRLPTGAVVTTVMANLGFRRAMGAHGIRLVETPVGDRHVLEAMRSGGHVLGGEQSGHVIFLERTTTGDGMITALELLRIVARSGSSLRELAQVVEPFPQVLRNVRTRAGCDLDGAAGVWACVRAEEATLGEGGRILVRASGTEPLVRVMVEAEDGTTAEAIAARIAESVTAALT